MKLCKILKLSGATSVSGRKDPRRHRNICVVLGCLAEKMAGKVYAQIRMLHNGHEWVKSEKFKINSGTDCKDV